MKRLSAFFHHLKTWYKRVHPRPILIPSLSSASPLLILLALLLLTCRIFTPAAAPTALTPSSPPASSDLPTRPAAPPKATIAAPQAAPASTQPPAVPEYPLQRIQLTGLILQDEAELSGLAWYGNHLILLPQYPERFKQEGYDGALFSLSRQAILDYIHAADPAPLEPQPIPLLEGDFVKNVQGNYEGFEAIGFIGDQVFLTIEASGGASMYGYLVKGTLAPDLSEMRLDAASLTENILQANFGNKSDESLFIAGDQILTIYEINGAEFNPQPSVAHFDSSLQLIDRPPFPNIEYRVTDASALDAENRFWVINYFYPGDVDIQPKVDPLAQEFGQGPTHAKSKAVERLVEMQYSPTGVTLTGTPPVQFQLDLLAGAYNWEGLARLDDLGFLLVTDKFPDTILAFVAYP